MAQKQPASAKDDKASGWMEFSSDEGQFTVDPSCRAFSPLQGDLTRGELNARGPFQFLTD
jgi:hypothetical protein